MVVCHGDEVCVMDSVGSGVIDGSGDCRISSRLLIEILFNGLSGT